VSVPSGKAVADAVVTMLNVSPSCNAMRLDAIKAAPPSADYTEVSAVPMLGGSERSGGWIGLSGSWRLLVRSVGTTEGNAYTFQSRARTSLEFALLTVGSESGAMCFETADVVAQDEGWFSSLSTFTVTL
jgi:hypothetical protein